MSIVALTKIIKSGSISPTDVTLSGSLTPEQAHNFVQVIKDNSDFLKKITVTKMGKLEKELDAWDVVRGILVRVASGDKPTEEQRRKLNKAGCKLRSQPVQLFARILKDTLEDNKDNPKFEDETFKSFTTAFGNDLSYLGFVGIADEYDDVNFNTLNKGWIQVAKESADVTKIEYIPADTTVKERLASIAKNIHPDAKKDTVILVSSADMMTYNEELATNAAANLVINGDADKILGIPLEEHPDITEGEYMATPLKNLVLGIGLSISRDRYYDSEERALKYIFDVYNDYEIVVKKWVTLLTPTV